MKWIGQNWKSLAAIIYLLVCILDFIVIPTFIIHRYTEIYTIENYRIIDELWGDEPMILQMLLNRKLSDWTPYTLRGAGMFHISFGAILTGTVLKKKKEE